MNKNRTDRLLLSGLSGLLVFLCLLCSDAQLFAQTQSPNYGETPAISQPSAPDGQQNRGHQSNSGQAPRQDNYYGTIHEGIVMETDPQTGTRIIQVTPPPEKEKDSTPGDTYVITPEIKINPR